MFTKSAAFYDLVYGFKDYRAESARVARVIRAYGASGGNEVLDVACGTGRHAALLAADGFAVEGVDLDPELLEQARARNPGAAFHQGDMVELDLGKRFDVVACLFSAVGYVKTVSRLDRTLADFARHVKPGGLVLVEPFFSPDEFVDGMPSMLTVDEPGLKLCRMNVSKTDAEEENPVAILHFFYQTATPDGVSRFEERHELGLFTREQYRAALERAGLRAEYDEFGLMGRGLWIGIADAV